MSNLQMQPTPGPMKLMTNSLKKHPEPPKQIEIHTKDLNCRHFLVLVGSVHLEHFHFLK